MATGKLILIIGGTNSGKTTLTKRMIGRYPFIVFDVNGEYGAVPPNPEKKQSRYTPLMGSMSEYIAICAKKNAGCYCVFEDATGFFSGAISKPMKQLIVGKRHPVSEGGRNIVLLFHSINTVPPFLLDTADYVMLLKTNDEPDRIKKKSARLLDMYYQLQHLKPYSYLTLEN